MKRSFYFVLIAVALSGCATYENYLKSTRSWIGAPKESLMAPGAWGAPDQVIKVSENKEMLVYIYDERGTTPVEVKAGTKEVRWEGDKKVVTETPPIITGGQEYEKYCKTTFYVDNGNIVDVAGKGNACAQTDAYSEALSRH